MKKFILSFSLFTIIITSIYYLISIFLNNNGQFINYYYPSNSISESYSNDTFLRKISMDSILVHGSKDFKNKIDSEYLIWIDKYKVLKSYGFLNLFSANYIDENKKILKISYKESNKKENYNYDDIIWVEYDNDLIENINFTNGKAYLVGDNAILKFFKGENKTQYIGTLKVPIRNSVLKN